MSNEYVKIKEVYVTDVRIRLTKDLKEIHIHGTEGTGATEAVVVLENTPPGVEGYSHIIFSDKPGEKFPVYENNPEWVLELHKAVGQVLAVVDEN